MTPQEKDLILSVFDRLARAGAGPRDAEAEGLINQRLVQQPDAVYGLVQAVILQEMSLNQAQQHIAGLEQQLAQARSGAAPQGGGSFLGGAVPNSGSRWGTQQAAPQPQPQPQPQYQQQAPQPQYAPQPQQGFAAPAMGGMASGAPSFLRSAATMAAGVAGGTLLAQGLSSMFGGHSGFGGGFGGGSGSPWGGRPSEVVENTTVNNYYGDQDPQSAGGQQQVADNSYQDAAYDDSASFDDGGYDDSQDV